MSGPESEIEPETGNDHPDLAWEERWQQGRTGWDDKGSHPSLVALLKSSQAIDLDILSSEGNGEGCKNALVPGCGTGYDVHLFASLGIDTIGIDISPTGVENAKKWIAEQSEPAARAEIICEDFLEYRPRDFKEFDLIYDYTFLCALHPSMRQRWSSTIYRLTHPSSILITLMYPLPPTTRHWGPPFSLTEGIYNDLLTEHWERIYEEDIEKDMMRKHGAPGQEKLVVWRKKQC